MLSRAQQLKERNTNWWTNQEELPYTCIRTYADRGVSLDASMEWRAYGPMGNSSLRPPMVRQLRRTLNTQLGRTR